MMPLTSNCKKMYVFLIYVYMCVYIYIYIHSSFSDYFLLCYYKILNIVHDAARGEVLVVYLLYI